MNATEAYETYLNGNISDFRRWLKKASKIEIVRITYIWQEHSEGMIRLLGFMGAR